MSLMSSPGHPSDHPDRSPLTEPEHALTGSARHRLSASLLVANLVLYATYAGVVAILLPQQIAELDPVGKVAAFAIVTGTSSLFTILAPPLVGAFSDRTRSRYGRRAPWLLVGGLGGGLATILMQIAPGIVGVALLWVVAQVLLNAFQAPLSAVIADRTPIDGRGTASAFAGVGLSLGATLGIVVAGQLIGQLGLGYVLFGGLIMVVSVVFVLVNPDRSSAAASVPSFRMGAFLRGFWVNPRRHPDVAWAFGGRFLMILGYQGVQSYQLYILTDRLGLGASQAGGVAGALALCTMVTLVLGTTVGGKLSDMLGRRKVFVFAASVTIAVAVAVPLFVPTVGAMFVYAVIVGLGFGVYLSVDLALMIDVLPSRGDIGRDLGLLTIAMNIPQAITPLVAAMLLLFSGGDYAIIFGFAAVIVLASAFLVLPIRSVR